MPVKKPEYTPVRAVRGDKTHATTLANNLKTACGIPMQAHSWVVRPTSVLGCEDCKKEIAKKPRRVR